MRFSGFDDEWNEVTLNDVATFSKGKGISKNDISNYGIECVRYGELYTKYNEMIYNIESKTDLDKNELKLSEKNDILIPCSGETAIDLATASCIQKDQVAIGGDITVIKTNQYAPFITYYLNQKKTEIAKYAQGVSIVHLYPKDFKVMNIRIPSINEQKMIIRLLEEITKKEQLLESKYQQYQEFKKFLMQKIFAQELRFTDYIEEWKTIKLKDVGEINTGNTPSTKVNEYYSPKKYLWVTPSDISSKYIFDTAKRLSDEGAKKGRFVKKNSVLVTCIASIGKNCIILEDGYFNQQINSITPSQSFDLDFIYYLIDYNSEKMKNYAGITATPILNKKSFENMKFEFPSFDEQKQISNMLSNIDNKIFAIEELINKTQKFKKGLLQQMFVVRINWRCNFKLAKSPSFNKHLLILKNKIIFIIIE